MSAPLKTSPPDPEPKPTVNLMHGRDVDVDTSGGAHVAGNVNVSGDFVGRDKNIALGKFIIPRWILWLVLIAIVLAGIIYALIWFGYF